MYNKLLRKILINKKYFFLKSLCLRKKERMHVDSLHDAYDFLQSVICRIKVKSIGRLYVIDDEFFRRINPERLACYSGDNNFQRRNTFFFIQLSAASIVTAQNRHHQVNVIARDVLSLANTGCPGPAPIHHT